MKKEDEFLKHSSAETTVNERRMMEKGSNNNKQKRYNKTFVNANIMAAVAEMKRRAYGNANSWGIGEYERKRQKTAIAKDCEEQPNENLMAMGTGKIKNQRTTTRTRTVTATRSKAKFLVLSFATVIFGFEWCCVAFLLLLPRRTKPERERDTRQEKEIRVCIPFSLCVFKYAAIMLLFHSSSLFRISSTFLSFSGRF